MKYTQNKEQKNNKTKISLMQRLQIAFYQMKNIKKIIMAIIGLLFTRYINQLLMNWNPINNFNNGYHKVLTILGIDNIPIVKDLSGNIIISTIIYILFLFILTNPVFLNKKIKHCKELGITDNKQITGNTIIPICEKYNSKTGITTLTCFKNGVVKEDFEINNNLDRLSSKWNRKIIKIEENGTNKLNILYSKNNIPKTIEWDDSFRDDEEFVIVLGIDDTGKIRKFDFNLTPSMIIASASGGGKTNLFKNIMFQSYKKGATILICDFKGGLDFSKGWNKLKKHNSKLITEYSELWDYLKYDLHDIVTDREFLLKKYQCSDVKEYNEKIYKGIISESPINRIIIGIDEASEIYRKSKNKETEKILEQIRDDIDKVSYRYRALGIHLVISTQVPSAQVLTENVRHNATIRVCGRADEILSNIAIGNDNASKIKAEERGRFATGGIDKYYFQSFKFDDEKLIKELIDKE